MKYSGIAISIVLLFTFVFSAMSLEPLLPGELEKYKKDGSYKDRLAFAKSLENDNFDPALIKNKKAQMEAGDISIAAVPPDDIAGLPSSGAPKIFALLIEFPDYPHYNSESVFADKLFGGGNSAEFPLESLTKYYSRSSYNALNIPGSSADVHGWYMAKNNRRYYKDNPKTPQNQAAQTLIKEALTYYDSIGTNFAVYDNDNGGLGDGDIDYFMVFWTGPDTGWATLWWGWYSRDIQLGDSFIVDGKTLRSFSWQWESNPGYYGDGNPNFNPGIIIHETGHALGLKDYYDYDSSVGPDGGVGRLDMMDGGQGDHNCFSKWLLSWVEPTIYGNWGEIHTTIPPLRNSATYPDCVAVMPGLTSVGMFGEYFMVQNRCPVGNDSKYPPQVTTTDGLIIWHVDATLITDPKNPENLIFKWDNSYTDHKLLRLMEADSLEEIERGLSANVGDFYVAGKVFSSTTIPNSNNYAGVYTGVIVNDILIDTLTKTITANIGIGPYIDTSKMHVSDISMSLKIKASNVNAIATVTIRDAANQLVSGATVSGIWSAPAGDSDSGITDSLGKVSLQSNVVRNAPSGTIFTFTVNNVTKTGRTYDPSANVETYDSITYPQAAPMLVKVYPTALENPYPSPGNPEMWIPFTLSDTKHVVIKIFSTTGQLLRTLDLGQKPSGAYISKEKSAYWDGRNEKGERISSGVYFCIMDTGDFTAIKKLVIAK